MPSATSPSRNGILISSSLTFKGPIATARFFLDTNLGCSAGRGQGKTLQGAGRFPTRRRFACVVSCEELLALHTLLSNHDALRGHSLTQQAKILSFDKARRAQGDRSHSLDSSRYATRDARSSRTGYSSREHSGTYAAARTRRDSDYAVRAAERLRYSEDDARDVRSRYAGEGTRNVRSRSRDSRRSASDRGPIGGRAYSVQSRDAYADSRLAWDDSLDEEGVEQEELEPETLSSSSASTRKTRLIASSRASTAATATLRLEKAVRVRRCTRGKWARRIAVLPACRTRNHRPRRDAPAAVILKNPQRDS